MSTRWNPSEKAIQSWREYRDDENDDPGEQELVLFAELNTNGNLVNEHISGIFYAVLPTNDPVPFGFNLQANWALNADRTAPLRESAWNKEIISHLPDLTVQLLQWVASSEGPSEIQEVYRRLPKLEMTPDNRPVVSILDDKVDFSSVVDALRKSPLIPVLSSPEPQPEDLRSSDPPGDEQNTSSAPSDKPSRLIARQWVVRPDRCTYRFVQLDECRCVPDAFLADLAPQFIRRWLGGLSPFAFSTKEPAGDFFRSMKILREPSNGEWISATTNYQSILKLLPSDLVRAWVAIHVVAATLRSNSQQYAPLVQLKILPNGHWEPCATSNLRPAAYQYYLSLKPEVHKILALDPQETPALALMLALMRISKNSNDKDDVDALTVENMFWPTDDKGRLRDITEPFFEKLAKDNPEDLIHRVVTVTTALRKLSVGNDAVTHILAKKGGQSQLFPKGEVWVGADYGFPYIERAAAGEIPIVVSYYGNDPAWKAFFISECQTRLKPKWRIFEQVYGFDNIHTYGVMQPKKPRESGDITLNLPLNLEETWAENYPAKNYLFNKSLNYFHVFNTTLHPWDKILENGNFDHARACAFAKVLADGDYSEKDHWENGGRKPEKYTFIPTETYVSWIATDKRRDYNKLSPISKHWIELLRNKAWVPTQDGRGVAQPKDVLFEFDPDNPDAPFADLDGVTREGLEPLKKAPDYPCMVCPALSRSELSLK